MGRAPVFSEEVVRRLAAVESAPSDADADWLMDRAQTCMAAGVLPEEERPLTRAIYALGRVGPWRRRAAVEWLGEVAAGPHREAWGAAAVATAVRHKDDPACGARLLELAADARIKAPARVLLALSAGAAGVPVLAGVLPEIEWRAAGLLRDVQSVLLAAPRGTCDPLALLNTEYERVSWIIRVLLLDDIKPGVAEPARVAGWLARIGHRGEPSTRRAAAAALGRLGHPAGRAWLQTCLQDTDAGVRRLAREALSRLPAGEASAPDPEDIPGTLEPLTATPAAWAALEATPRRVPIAYWLDRALRGGGAMTWVPWTLIAVGGVAEWLRPADSLLRIALFFGLIWHIVALPVSVVFAARDVKWMRWGFATLGQVGQAQRRVSTRRVRGSTIRVTWHDLPVQFLGDDGGLHEARMYSGRALAAGEGPEPVLHAPGEPSTVVILRAQDALRVDARGRLRFGWSLRGLASVGIVGAALVSCALLLVRLVALGS